jgi:hypothetical protein
MTITWKQVQREFNRNGVRIGSKKAKAVAKGLPVGAQATGWSELQLLRIIARQADNGAPDRVIALGGEDGS